MANKPVCLNLEKTPYFHHTKKGLTFYFSSQFNLVRYMDQVDDYVESQIYRIFSRYKIDVDLELMFTLSLYEVIEKRGYRVFNESTGKEYTKWERPQLITVIRQISESLDQLDGAKATKTN